MLKVHKAKKTKYVLCRWIVVILFCATLGCKDKREDKSITLKNGTPSSLGLFDESWINTCSERDFIWASFLVKYAIESQHNAEEMDAIAFLNQLKEAVEQVQLSDQYLDIREPLLLTEHDQMELAEKLAKYFDLEIIKGAAWNYKDSFIESLIILLQDSKEDGL